MRQRFRLARVALIFGLVGTGCSLLPDRPAPAAVHDFGPLSMASRTGPRAWSDAAVHAPDWLQDSKLRYRLLYRQPTRVQFYALDRWVAPPPQLLAQSLSAAAGRGGCPLRIDLQTFEQVFERPGRARVVVEFMARTVEAGAGADRTVAEQYFALSRPCASADAAGAVTAFSLAIGDAIGRLDTWLRSSPPDALAACRPVAERLMPGGR